ncbi:DUF1642 domain-containing protein [Streptococcus suis]|uniref:DUF1642 domain-containing protein n=1 Tax=Streptococcus suis TaxID=1307 RepID=UPI0004210366|nr:DUF1642 domain-containing protein [Streptococcus suis]
MNKHEAIEKLTEIANGTGWISYTNACNIISEINIQPQKVVVPKFVAEWIKETKERHPNLRWVWTVYPNDLELNKWLDTNTETFMLAWLFGYEVEQEPLYTVEIPNPNNTSANVLCLRKDGGKIHISKQNHKTYKQSRYCHLTEAEIKEDFEWAWDAGFAKEVE